MQVGVWGGAGIDKKSLSVRGNLQMSSRPKKKGGMCVYGEEATLSKRNKALFCLLANTASIVFTKQPAHI